MTTMIDRNVGGAPIFFNGTFSYGFDTIYATFQQIISPYFNRFGSNVQNFANILHPEARFYASMRVKI